MFKARVLTEQDFYQTLKDKKEIDRKMEEEKEQRRVAREQITKEKEAQQRKRKEERASRARRKQGGKRRKWSPTPPSSDIQNYDKPRTSRNFFII